MASRRFAAVLLPLAVLAGCASIPGGPSELALPGSRKTFDQFRFDDGDCRRFASAQVGGASGGEVATDSGVKSAAVGTGVGALAGAAIGGGRGAATGAGLGLIVGAIAGVDAGDRSSYSLQQRYDGAYKQCMYAKGHKVPVQGNVGYSDAGQPARRGAPPAALIPPPPPAAR